MARSQISAPKSVASLGCHKLGHSLFYHPMQPMTKLTLLVVSIVPLVVISSSIARADDTEGVSTQLLPLENRSLVIEVDADHLQTAAEEINTSTFGGKETSGNVLDLGETLGIDEDGGTRLPLGIRVFSTLGDPSIGFGGDF